jgi:hypothetical protein
MIFKVQKYQKKNIQTSTEKIFYQILKQKLPNYYIGVQVSMSAIIESNIEDRKNYNRSYLDYVICDEQVTRPLLIIELDDSTHNKEKRKDQDQMKNAIIQDAKIPLYRVKVGDDFRIKIQNEIIPILQNKKSPPKYEAKYISRKQKETKQEKKYKSKLIEKTTKKISDKFMKIMLIGLIIYFVVSFLANVIVNQRMQKIQQQTTPPKTAELFDGLPSKSGSCRAFLIARNYSLFNF